MTTGATTRAIVVNAGTDLAATVALASLRENAPDVAVLLVDGSPSPESQQHFERLADQWGFDLRVVRRTTHAATLDALVDEIEEPELLLFDSDMELRDPALIPRLRRDLEQPGTYGAGYLVEAAWLPERWGSAPETCWCRETVWTPFALLRTSVVRAARQDGVGFAPKTVYNDFAPSRYLSALLAGRFDCRLTPNVRWLRLTPRPLRPAIQRSRLSWLRWARAEFDGMRPNFVYYDTAARLHEWCKEHDLRFEGVSCLQAPSTLVHLVAASIELRDGGAPNPELVPMENDLRHRLHAHYGLDWSSFGLPAWSALNESG